MEEGYRAIVGAVSAGTVRPQEQLKRAPLPFVTIARQAGAGGNTLKERLVQRLAMIDKADPPWSGFDHELIDKVAADHHLSTPLLESLDEGSHSYLDDLLFAGFNLSGKPEPTELTVYRRIAKTIRALARVGRVVIVGRGGVFLTEDLPTGVHVNLVAPREHRIEMTRRARNLSHDEAAKWVEQVDKNREAFFHRHWPKRSLSGESFTVTFNTATLSDEQITEALLPLIPGMQAKDAKHKALHAEHAHP